MSDSQEERPEFTAADGGRTNTTDEVTVILEDAQRQARDELRRVEQIVTKIIGLPSNWSGTVELHDSPAWRGAKPFRCDILLDAGRQEMDVRWRTHLHEMLHAHSSGYTRYAFEAYPGWEEGVVERLQRLLRPVVLAQLGLAIPPGVFAAEEDAHEFNPYIRALDSLFALLQRPNETEAHFYVALLALPLNQRLQATMQRGMALPPAKRATFLRTFALASVILRSDTPS